MLTEVDSVGYRGNPRDVALSPSSRFGDGCSSRAVTKVRRGALRKREELSERRIGQAAEEIRAMLGFHHGRVADAARALGLSSRYALYRLLKKHRIEPDVPSTG